MIRKTTRRNDMLYVNGKWIESTTNKMEVVNPATGEVIAAISTGGKKETNEAIASAEEAFSSWKKLPGPKRGKYLQRVVQLMRERVDELAETITKENGKPLPDAKGEVISAIEYLNWYAEEAKRIYGDTLPASHTDKQLLVLREPIGVCAAITPWNFPLSMITRKIAPALAAGCTVVLKPAEQTPLSAIRIFECFHDAHLPKGVVNLVIGAANEIGTELTSHPAVRKLTFTGSTAVGKKLYRDSAATMKKVSMELGGHAPYIVFADADLDVAINGILLSKFKNAGQTCISTNRIYVAESIAEQFGKKLAEKVSELKIGNGLEEGVEIGPLIDQQAMKKVNEQIVDAVDKGGKVIHGGKEYEPKRGDGYFYEPTIVQHATEDMKIASEETFGPVAPIFSFRTEEEVIEKANHESYGLAAYCFTNDLGRGLRMIRELEFGIVGLNDPTPIVIQAPFGGVKESGIGNEGGKYGLDEYLEEKFVSIRTN